MSRDFGLLPTTVVGSYPQPDWLIDREGLEKVPRLRAPQRWRIAPEWLDAAADDATIVAIRDQERAGVDIVSDGEIRRESYSNHFVGALEGIAEEPGIVHVTNDGVRVDVPVPLFSAPARRIAPVEVDAVRFLRANTDRAIRVTLPGPFTMSQQALPGIYGDREALSLDLAAAVNAEVRDLFAAGADIVQLDEPWLERFPDDARRYGVSVLNRALDGAQGTTAIHVCFGYGAVVAEKPKAYPFLEELADTPIDHVSIEAAQPDLDLDSLAGILPAKTFVVGVLDLRDPVVETPEIVAERIERAVAALGAERVMVGPDCGMKFLPRERAFAKLCAMVAGASLARARLGGT